MLELEEPFGMFDVDDRVKCIIVTGHGRIFCADVDLEQGFVEGQELIHEHWDGRVHQKFQQIQATSPFLAVNYSTNYISIYVCLTFLHSTEGLSNPRDQLLPQARKPTIGTLQARLSVLVSP